MATKKVDTDFLTAFAGRLKAGTAIYPEDADRFIVAAGLDEDAVNAAAAVPRHTIEFDSPGSVQTRVPITVDPALAQAEAQGLEDADKAVSEVAKVERTKTATLSNDPAENVMAVGGEPFANTAGIGSSGQVIDAASYKPAEESSK